MKITAGELVDNFATVRELGEFVAKDIQAAINIASGVEKITKIVGAFEKQRQSLVLEHNITDQENKPTPAQQKKFHDDFFALREEEFDIEPFFKKTDLKDQTKFSLLPISKLGFLAKFIIQPEVNNAK